MMSAKPTDSYQHLRQKLDTVMQQLQDPDCDIDAAAKLYEQALDLVAKLEQRLAAAEAKVQKVRVDFGLDDTSSGSE
jgi:exodeoxyribonuclease VII small subunit